MNIALDYDGTYTRDPDFWNHVIEFARARGHKFYCVTARHSHETMNMPCPIIFSERRAKTTAVREAGLTIDIWIDDNPQFIFMSDAK